MLTLRQRGPGSRPYVDRQGVSPIEIRAMPEPPAPLCQTVSHYRILQRLGGGGMGVVYRTSARQIGPGAATTVYSGGGADIVMQSLGRASWPLDRAKHSRIGWMDSKSGKATNGRSGHGLGPPELKHALGLLVIGHGKLHCPSIEPSTRVGRSCDAFLNHRVTSSVLRHDEV
jgi:hypothetical protein